MKKRCCWVTNSTIFLSRVFNISLHQNTLQVVLYLRFCDEFGLFSLCMQASKGWNRCCRLCCCCRACCCFRICGARHLPDSLSDVFPRQSGKFPDRQTRINCINLGIFVLCVGSIVLHHLRQTSALTKSHCILPFRYNITKVRVGGSCTVCMLRPPLVIRFWIMIGAR